MGVLLLGVRRIAILPRPSAKRPVLFTVVHTYLQQSNAANVVPVSQDASRARLCRFLVSSWWSPGSVLKHSELPGLTCFEYRVLHSCYPSRIGKANGHRSPPLLVQLLRPPGSCLGFTIQVLLDGKRGLDSYGFRLSRIFRLHIMGFQGSL